MMLPLLLLNKQRASCICASGLTRVTVGMGNMVPTVMQVSSSHKWFTAQQKRDWCSRVPRGWTSNVLLQMLHGRGALGWDVRIISDRCVALAPQTRHTDTWNCPAQVKPNTPKVWSNGKNKEKTLIICTPHVWGLKIGWELDFNHFWMFAR